MARFSLTLSLALGAVLCTAQIAMAETRAERNLRPAGDTRIADLPAGHWATNASQVVLANNILTLEDGAFNGDRLLTGADLDHAMNTLVATAEAIASEGHNDRLRSAVGTIASDSGPITRQALAGTLASFLDACASQGLVAIAAPNHDASRFKDVGAAVPPAVATVVDKFKVMTGYPDNTFRPDVKVSRYQMAAIAFNVLNTMRMAPMAQLPVKQAGGQTIVVVQPPTADPVEVVIVPSGRLNFRERAPLHVAWQAVNVSNVASGAPFTAIPIETMLTVYNGPLMFQNVTDIKVSPYTANMVDSQFRVGYAGFKRGMWQAIPYVGAHLGAGASPAVGDIQYDSYAGVTYGGILSLMPSDVLEFHAQVGQTQLMAAGRFTGAFQPKAYPNAIGSVLTSYGVGGDFYVAPNICLTLGINTWQNPASLRVGDQTNALGIVDTFGLNMGMGTRF